jgi:uncharacterized membrane protein
MLETSRRRSSTSSIVLALSLGLNLFFAGWEITQNLAAPHYSRSDTAPEVVSEAIAGALPTADGNLLRRAVDDKRQPLEEARRRYLVALEHARQVISAEPLDEAALHDAVAQVRASRQAERVLFGDTIVSVIPRMSPQGRQAFVTTVMGGRP